MGVRPFFSRLQSLVLEHGHIFESRIALQIGDPQRIGLQHALDLSVRQLRETAGMVRGFDNNFMRTDSRHPVVNPLGAAARITFDAVKRAEVWIHSNLPRPLPRQFEQAVGLDADSRAEWTRVLPHFFPLGVPDHDPAPRNWILPQFHVSPQEIQVILYCSLRAGQNTATRSLPDQNDSAPRMIRCFIPLLRQTRRSRSDRNA